MQRVMMHWMMKLVAHNHINLRGGVACEATSILCAARTKTVLGIDHYYHHYYHY